MATYEDMAAMGASQGYIGGYGPNGGKGQNIDPNAFRSHPNFQTHSPHLPSYHTMGRPDEKEPAANPVGESASYDNLPSPSETAFNKPAADIGSVKGQGANVSHKARRQGNGDKERDLMDFFYKKPDPNYSGLYGADYEPQISKTKVAVAAAAVVAVAYGFSKYKSNKRENLYRQYEKYPRSTERRHRRRSHNQSQSTAPSQYEYESAYDGHHRY
ncbi:hypothetical protein GGI23_006728 [Coemansia sp. RSA 2559]|nr:hypothetical protein GGI23_006728 [Coemansia sp. RSA 2559]KAJ2844969.1 hypothetical protein GGI22_006708 [Coemansia erecta]